MTDTVTYTRTDLVSTVAMDNGKVNVFSIPMLHSLHETFDQAETRRDGGPFERAARLLHGGFRPADAQRSPPGCPHSPEARCVVGRGVLSFPAPVTIACTGHAFPAGAFLLMAADSRLGADGPFRLGHNEVRIGLTLPLFAIVLGRHRLTPAHFDHAAVTGEMSDPQAARAAGLLDAVVPAAELDAYAERVASDIASLDRSAHVATKLRVRKPVLDELRAAIDVELV